MNVSISVVSDKTILVNKALADATGGKAVRVKAVKGGRYLLAENGSGVAPENITVKRVGKNLHVALEGSDPDQPELIIEDFFGSNGQLIGLGEDGKYHEYIAADGDNDSAAAFLMDGVSSPLALGYPQIVGFGEGLAMIGGGMLPWALAGIGSLAGGAIAEHNKGGDNKVVDTTPPENKGIGSIVDDKGPIKGEIGNGGVTDDGRPTLSGSGQQPGDKVQVIDNGKVIGEVIVDGGGNWSFTPEKDLGEGEHVLEIIVKDPAGNSSDPSEEIIIIIDSTAPTKPGIDSVIDDQGPVTGQIVNGGHTDDTQPTLSGKGDAGDTVSIFDNGKVIGEVQVGDDGRWTFTPGLPLAEGEHVLEVVVTDPAGNSSKPSDEFVVIVDTTAPSKPGVGGVIDDQGPFTGPVDNGGMTDDSQPTLTGKGDPGNTVTIIDNGKVVGEVQVGDDGNWSFTPEFPLEEGEHALEVVVTDPAGNSSGPSDEFVIIVDTTPPAKPSIEEIIDDQGAVTGPVVNGGLTDDSQPTLSGKGDVGDTVTIIGNGKVIGEVLVGQDGSWSFTPEDALGEGEHVFEVVITDPAGNASAPSDQYVVIVDTTPPVNGGVGNVVDDQGSITGPVGNGGVTDDSQPTLSGKGDAGDTVTIIDNGKVVGEVQVGDDGTWTFTPEDALEEGEHSFEVVVTDPAGNSSGPSDEFVIIVDTTPPTNGGIESIIDDQGAVTGPINNGQTTDDTTPTLAGKGDAGDTVTIIDNGKVIGDVLVGEDGTWSFTLEQPLDQGEHAFEVVITDPAGNSSGPSDEYVIKIDSNVPKKPVIESVIDDQGDYKGALNPGDVTDDNKPVFSGTAEPNTTVIIKDKGVEIGRVPADADGKWTFEPAQALPYGKHEVTAEAVNAAGTASEPSDGFAFDLTSPGSPPAPAITSVVDDVGSITGNIQKNAVTDDARPTINGTAEIGTTVSVYIDGALAGTAEVAGNGDWSFTPSQDLGDGLHNITAKATNGAGNSSPETGKYPINVDTLRPGKPDAGDAQLLDDEGAVKGAISTGMETDDTTPTFKGNAEPNGTVIIYDNGTEIGRVPTDAAGDWSFTPSPELELGEHSFDYQVMDKAGNVSEKSDAISFQVIDGGVEVRITGAIDDAGSLTGPISKNGVTDDTTPTLQGKATAGGTVKVYEGDALLGETLVDGEGNWSFTPTTPLSEGAHSLTATVTTEATGESEASSAFDFSIDTTQPNKPLIESISDDVGSIQGKLVNGQDTDDTTPTLAGKAEAGSTVRIYDNGSLLGSVVADANGSWNYTASPPLLNGKHEFTVTAVDKAGNVSEPSDAFAINIDTMVPDRPVILGAYDDQGDVHGALQSGGITDDAKPVFNGTAEPNTTVVVMDKGVEIGRAPVGAVFTVISIDNAGNASNPSSTFTVKIEAEPPRSVATILSMEKDSGFNSSDWVTNDASAGRLIRGSLNAALGGGEVLQVSTDGGATWSNAVVNGTSWSALDMSSHAQSWEISVRVAASTGLTGAVTSQTVILDQTAPDAPTRVMANEGVCTVTFSDESLRSGDLLDFVSNGKHYQHALTAQEVAAGVAVVSLPSGMVEGVVVGIIDSAGNVSDYRALSLLGSEIFDFDDLTDGQDIGTEYTFGSVTAMGLGWLSGSYYPDYNGGTPTLWLEGQRPFGIHHDTEFRLATPADGVSFYFHTNSSIEPVYVSFHDENGIEIGRLDYVRGPLEPPGFVDFKAPEGTTISSFHYATPFGEWGGGYIDNMVITRNSTGGGIVPPALVHKVVGEDVGFYGGSGNDVFELSSSAFFKNHGANVRGGGGLDTLKFSGAGTMLDLMDIKGEVSSVEVFDIAGSGANMLSLGLSDVLSNGAVDQFYSGSKSHVQLMVVGDGDDVLNLRNVLMGGSGPGHWKDAGQVSIAGVSYQSYQYSAFAAEVLVSRGVSVNVVNAQGMGELQPASAGDGLNEGNVIPLLVQTEDELFSNQVGIQSDYLSVDMSQGSVGSYALMTNVDRYALHQIESEIY